MIIHALHGAVGAPSDWDGLSAALADTATVRPVDLHARVAPFATFARAFNLEAAQEDEAVRSSCADGDPGSGARAARLLLGYSLGGRLALHALVAEGAAVWRGAVIVSAHPGLPAADAAGRRTRLAGDLAWSRRAAAGSWDAFLEAWNAQPVFAGGAPPADRRPLERIRDRVAASFDTWSLARQDDLLAAGLAAVDVPVLWITGERDPRFTALAREACRRIPSAEHVVVPGAGHRVPWEAADAFARAIRWFASARAIVT